MDRTNKSINIVISGKNFAGEDFKENAQLESFGSFGMLIYTNQKLRLGDVMHICGTNGKPLASAEAVWVRGGDTPAIEVLLHRNTDLAELRAGMRSMEEQMASQSSAAAAASKATRALSKGTGVTSLLGTNSDSNAGLSASNSVSASDVASMNDTSSETINCPSCSRANPINAKSCKFCGVYLSRGGPGATRALDFKNINASASVNNSTSANNSLSPAATANATTPLVNKEESSTPPASIPSPVSAPAPAAKRPARETASPKQQKTNVAEKKASMENLQQFRKIAFISLTVLVIILAVTFLSFGSTAFSPTPIGIVEQKNCYEIGSLKRQVSDTSIAGEIDVWGQVNNGSIQFIRHDSSAEAAIAEAEKLTNTGIKLHGCWCQKLPTKNTNDASALPSILSSIWALKPTGENQYANEYRIQFKDNVLLIKEIIGSNTLERTPDIKQVLYYTGVKKLVVKLGDTTANVSAPALQELTFYLPSNQDTAAAAEGQLSNSVRAYLTAQPNGQEGSSATLILIVRIVLGFAIFINLGYLVTNFSQANKLEAN